MLELGCGHHRWVIRVGGGEENDLEVLTGCDMGVGERTRVGLVRCGMSIPDLTEMGRIE